MLKDIFILPNRIFSINKADLSNRLSHLSDNDINELNNYILNIQGISNREKKDTGKSEVIRTFKDLIINGSNEELNKLKQKLIEKIESDDRRSLESKEEYPDLIMIKSIGITKIDDSIIFFNTGEAEFKITNIIPIVKSNLDFIEYNNVVDDFYKNIINPLVRENSLNLNITITTGFHTLEDLVNEEVAKKLKLFSRAANKSTGFSHPLDRERWLDFVASSFKTGNILNLDYLGRWFAEIEGWSYEVTNELIINYEYSIDLLTFCKENDGNDGNE